MADIKIKQDPIALLPEEPMSYEIKKKKKKKKIKRDPLREGIAPQGDFVHVDIKQEFDVDVEVKIENIEVAVDCTELIQNGIPSENSQGNTDNASNDDMDNDYKDFFEDNKDFVTTLKTAATYICNTCYLVFSSENTLRIHETRAHNLYKNNLKFQCDHCKLAYHNKSSLKVHIKRKHMESEPEDDKELLVCDVCSSTFIGKARMAMHKHRKHGSVVKEFTYECQHCGLCYGKDSSLRAHMQRKHKRKITTPELYKCPFCPKSFYIKSSLMTHVKRNHKIKANADDIPVKFNQYGDAVCELCSLTFTSVKKLRIHMQRKHNALNQTFNLNCAICNLSYENLTSLRRHLKRKHDDNSYCQTCQKQFDTYESFINHTHGRTILECGECGKIFENPRGYSKHMSSKHKKLQDCTFFCDSCGKGFMTMRDLKTHLNTHLNKKYFCGKCNKNFKTQDSLRNHVRKHEDQKISKRSCIYCQRIFTDENELCSHIDSEHIKNATQDENKYNCPKCPQVFPSWNLLSDHNNIDHLKIEKKYDICNVCNEKVTVKSFERHLKTHSVNYKCQYCEFETKVAKLFTIHMLKHDVETLKCGADNCSFSTNNASKLIIHSKIHSVSEEKYQCQFCSFVTLSKYAIKYHEREHKDGKKLYKCSLCPYTTYKQPNIFQHKNKHSTDKKYKCDTCSFASKYSNSLRFHIKTQHKDLPITKTNETNIEIGPNPNIVTETNPNLEVEVTEQKPVADITVEELVSVKVEVANESS